MANWTHSMCGECWLERHLKFNADGTVAFKPPARVLDAAKETCCFCGGPTRLGIYVRHDPKEHELLDCVAALERVATHKRSP